MNRLQYNTDGETLDEVVMHNANVHLEQLDDSVFMLIVENDNYHWHLRIGNKRGYKRRNKVEAWMFEEESKGDSNGK